MKVISGIAHGTNLKSPDILGVRPTISRIKEAIFNSIAFELPGATFLDLYSGSGAIGIEALSRGAKKSIFIDQNKKCTELIKKNLELTKLNGSAQIICMDVCDGIKKLYEQKVLCDFVFMDPPYNKNLVNETMSCLEKFNILAPDAIIICETSATEIISKSDRFDIFKTKLYNKIMINYAKER